MLTPEIARLTEKLLNKINKKKKQGEIVGIDSSKLYTLAMLYGPDDKLTKEMKEIKLEMIDKKKRDIVLLTGSKKYDLSLIMNKEGELNDDIKEIFIEMKKRVNKGEVMQIDSTLFYNLPLDRPEMAEFKEYFIKIIKKGRLGEICEVDMTMFYNLPIFQKNPEELENNMKELRNYLMLQMVRQQINPGEILKIDSSYHYYLPLIIQNIQM